MRKQWQRAGAQTNKNRSQDERQRLVFPLPPCLLPLDLFPKVPLPSAAMQAETACRCTWCSILSLKVLVFILSSVPVCLCSSSLPLLPHPSSLPFLFSLSSTPENHLSASLRKKIRRRGKAAKKDEEAMAKSRSTNRQEQKSDDLMNINTLSSPSSTSFSLLVTIIIIINTRSSMS